MIRGTHAMEQSVCWRTRFTLILPGTADSLEYLVRYCEEMNFSRGVKKIMKQSFVSLGLAAAMLYGIGCERNIFVKKRIRAKLTFPHRKRRPTKRRATLSAVLRSGKESRLASSSKPLKNMNPPLPSHNIRSPSKIWFRPTRSPL